MLTKLLVLIAWVTLLPVCAFAFLKGGRTERSMAGALLIASILSPVANGMWDTRWNTVPPGLLAVDLALLLAFVSISLQSRRYWPMWCTSFHAVGVATHIAKLIDPQLVSRDYAFMQGFWVYPMLVTIVIGTADQVWQQSMERRLAAARG